MHPDLTSRDRFGCAVARLTKVEVDYDRVGTVLGPISLEIAPGEILALVGPSGCGKSTLLRLLAFLEEPTRGAIELSPAAGETGVVFQSPTLAPWLSALANVALPLRLAGVKRSVARSSARAALERVGLGEAAAIRPARLSGGMAMRVSLARAQVANPRLLLLDEPFAALDDPTRRRLARDVHALWMESRPAIVFVTHNVEEAVYMAQRVLVLGRCPGRIRGEFVVDGPLPRPGSFRSAPGLRQAADLVTNCLLAASPSSW